MPTGPWPRAAARAQSNQPVSSDDERSGFRDDMSSTTEHSEQWPTDDFVPTEALARRQGVKPITSVEELAQPDPWESDEEYEAFLADLYASRRAGLA
jgi:hypothetical protein